MNAHKKFFSKIGADYFILGIMTIVFQAIIINIINVINPIYLNDFNILTALSALCNYILPFPIFYLLMKRLPSQTIEKHSIDFKTLLKYTAITITLMQIGNIISVVITAILSGAIQSEITNPVHQLINNNNILINLLVISIIAPIFEEIFFRKFLIDRTIKYGARVSIILSAALFGFFHGNINQFFYTFLMGGFFAYVYIKTGKITYPIILHSIINMIGSVLSLFIQSSISNLKTAINPMDLGLLIIYFLIIFLSLLIGVWSLFNYKQAKFNGEKTEINLKYPLNTVFVNYGMIIFIGFFIILMVKQAFF